MRIREIQRTVTVININWHAGFPKVVVANGSEVKYK